MSLVYLCEVIGWVHFTDEECRLFLVAFLPITARSRDADPDQPFEQWTDLKNDLANYRLNSLILMKHLVTF